MRFVCHIVILCSALTGWSQSKDEVDHLALATIMLRDGHIKRASAALEKVDLKKGEIDQSRYFTLQGVIRMRLKNFEGALESFDAVIKLGSAKPELHLSRARCAYAIKRCDTVQSALSLAGQAAKADPDFFVMGSECAWQLKDHNRALVLLTEAQARFPTNRNFGRMRVQRLLSLGLYQMAAEVGRTFVNDAEANQDDILFLAEALLKSKQADAAVEVLEKSRLQYPEDNRIRAQSAHAWLAKGFPRTAARLFLDAAITEEKYARDAAEIYRELLLPHQALRANARILDQDLKLRQRLAILIDMERFEAVTALEPRLSRLELLNKDEELRYAVAYAYYRIGSFKGAENHLKKISTPALFARAANLRKAMADCRKSPESCD